MTRIQLKLGAVLAGLVAVVVLAAGYLAERSLVERELRDARESLAERARLVSELVAGLPLRTAHREELQALAARAGRAAGARVTLVAPDGAVVADSAVPAGALPELESHAERPELRAALAGRLGTDTRLSKTVGRRFLYLALPEPGRRGGAVRLAVDLSDLDAAVAGLRRTLMAAGLAGTLLAVLLGALLAGRLLQPLRELRDVLDALAAGDLQRRLPWRSRDEFGRIADAIGRMADELRDRIRDLTGEKEQLRAVLQGMVEGVLVVDRKGRVVLANPRLRELFGVWREVAGRPALEVIRRTEVERALEEAGSGSEPVLLELSAGAGDQRKLQMHAVRFPAQGEHLGTVAVFHDVTELRRLERVRSEFVANVSHELKTPLTAIRGFAETLQSEGLKPEQRRQYLEVILRHAKRLSALIDDLLELSRIEGRQGPVEHTPVDVEAATGALLQDLGPRLAARRLEARLVATGAPRALTDRRAFEQVLLNLLDNAIKYTDPGGRIQVRVVRDGERVRVDVSDTGIGIPEEDQSRIFERFYRVSKARSRDLGGTGLGLSIVKHLVQALGGEVYVESQEGKGTTFSVRLPAA